MGVPVVPTISCSSGSGGCPESVRISRTSRGRVSLLGSSSSSSQPDNEVYCVGSPLSSFSKKHSTSSSITRKNKVVVSPRQSKFDDPQHGSGASLSSLSITSSSSFSSFTAISSSPSSASFTKKRRRSNRKSLCFAIVAGAISLVQLTCHIGYLLHRYRHPEHDLTALDAPTQHLLHHFKWKNAQQLQYRNPKLQGRNSLPTSSSSSKATSITQHSLPKRVVSDFLSVPLLSSTATTASYSSSSTASEPAATSTSSTSTASHHPQRQQQQDTPPLLARQLLVQHDESTTSIDDPRESLLHAEEEDSAATNAAIPRIPPQSQQPRYEVLVVVPGLGEASRIETVHKSMTQLSSTISRSSKLDCIVYVWNATILTKAQDTLGGLCSVELSLGMWTHHMSRVPSVAQSNYTHVALLLDDVDVSDVHLEDFLELQDWSNFGVASPAFEDPIYPTMHVRYNCFFHQTDFVNIFFAVFQTSIWTCWQSHLDLIHNPLGWGMDATIHELCYTTLGVIDAYSGIHLEALTSYSQQEARQQMYQYIATKINSTTTQQEALQYLECAGHTRPAAFEECQVYWDGTIATNPAVDWKCS